MEEEEEMRSETFFDKELTCTIKISRLVLQDFSFDDMSITQPFSVLRCHALERT